MSPLPPPPTRRWPYFALRLVLVAAIVVLLIHANDRLFFHTASYEAGDRAANSLSVLRAEHGVELQGNYSRWEFHHPGPAVFYGEGWSELLLYRWLHLVPTPFTAQWLFNLVLMSAFFAAGISVAARWMRSGAFVWLALGFAALEFAAANASELLLVNWPPFMVGMTLFALLVAAASVGAGQGDDLPLLVLAGGFLLHMHVAQPLFVGPMFGLAYIGLFWSCWRRGTAALNTSALPTNPADAPAVPAPAGLRLPWRVYRGGHRWALLIAVVFALPLLLDLFYGSRSNFTLIVEHLRTYKGRHHPYLTSLDYFLRFAVYQPSLPNESDHLGTIATPHSLLQFVVRHPQMLGLWLAALCTPLLALAVRVWRGRETPLLGTPPDSRPLAYRSPVGRWRFLGWLWLVWALSVALTLVWGHIQDGEMFYFNAWFNYLIWYVLALLAAGSLADALDAFVSRAERPLFWRLAVVLPVLALAVFVVRARPDRFVLADDVPTRLQAESVSSLLDNEPAGTPRAKLLIFPERAWVDATGIAVALTRHDRAAYVLPVWEFMFGSDHVLKDWETYVSRPVEVNTPFEVWHLVPSTLVPVSSRVQRLPAGYTLVLGGLPVDPTSAFRLTFSGPEPNCLGYLGAGWSHPDGGGFSWSGAKTAWMQFQPRPVPPGQNVVLTCDFSPYVVPGKRDAQRVTAFFNGLDVGTLRVTDKDGAPFQFVIPGDVWNKYPSVLLAMQFPDAISPSELFQSNDTRQLAVRARSITFTTLSAVTPPPTPSSTGSAPETTSAPVSSPEPVETPTTVAPEAAPPAPVMTPTVEPTPEAPPAPTEPTPVEPATPSPGVAPEAVS